MPLEIINSHKVAMFDVDGLLIDSEPAYNEYWHRAGSALGYELTKDMLLELRSLDAALAQEKFAAWFGDADAYLRVRTRRREMMSADDALIACPLKTGAKEMVSFAREMGLKTAIVTSSPQQRILAILGRYSFAELFDYIICADKVKRNKPFSDIYLYAASQLGVEPEECIAFEDSPNGLKSAHGAGCFTVMIPDISPYSEELKTVADYHMESLQAFCDACRKELEEQQ